jgi:hypothetical protein
MDSMEISIPIIEVTTTIPTTTIITRIVTMSIGGLQTVSREMRCKKQPLI